MKTSVQYSFLILTALATPPLLAAPAAPTTVNVERALEQGSSSSFEAELKKLPKLQRDAVIRSLAIDPRIIGGSAALISDFPWQVALVRGSIADPMRSQFCGGTLIARNLVVTAAHCVDNAIVRSDPKRLAIIAGASAFETGGQRVGVTAVFKHPNWNRETFDFDVAVLRLDASITVGRPIKLGSSDAPTGQLGWVSGWGATTEGGPPSNLLMAVEVPVIDNMTCNAPESYGGVITSNMLCAGDREGGKDSCQGDSGGPLVVGTTDNERQIGIVSWGEGCARRLKYGIYTRVSKVADWIASLDDSVPLSAPALGNGLFSLPSQSKIKDQ